VSTGAAVDGAVVVTDGAGFVAAGGVVVVVWAKAPVLANMITTVNGTRVFIELLLIRIRMAFY
jgi:hypothetical protein